MSDPVQTLISSLMKDGKILASLFLEAKTQQNRENSVSRKQERLKNIDAKVSDILKQVNDFQVPGSFPENIIPRVLQKIQAILEEFLKLDPANAPDYEELVKRVKDCKSHKQTSAAGLSLSSQHNKVPASGSGQIEASAFDNPQVDHFASLGDTEKQCLFCFCLFSIGKEVKKREPIHLWIGMDLVHNQLKGAEMLAMLVAQGFIQRIVGNKKLCNRYKMNEIVYNMLIKEMNVLFTPDYSLSIMDQQPSQQQQPAQQQQSPPQQLEQQHPPSLPQQSQQQQEQHQPPQQQTMSILKRVSTFYRKNQDPVDVSGTLVLNKSENVLHAKTFERLSKKKNNVKVLHLGSCHHNSERYIVVEEIEALKALAKNIGQLTFLSLQGISGIVELPDSIYKLENLKVLDLRACPNLESLSEGIESLKHLMHLDLSECYLLDYIPKGIASLTKLRVLKGFVINPQNPKERKENINTLSCALFSDLSSLKELIKLTIRTRRKSFPTGNDFDTLHNMKNLISLRIAWVQSTADDSKSGVSGRFPTSLKKLELQAAPHDKISQLLRLISEDAETCLEKLYIRGGRVWELGIEMHHFRHVHTVRLRYLPHLRIYWDEFKELFPKLSRLQVLGCPNLIFFPCDENGRWEQY